MLTEVHACPLYTFVSARIYILRSRKELVACKAIQDATKEADLMTECRFHMKLNHANIVEVRGVERSVCDRGEWGAGWTCRVIVHGT